jgi:hypothetical protein
MTSKELDTLKGALGRVTRYLEFGTGNSTKLAAACPGIVKIVAVESYAPFFKENVATDPLVKAGLQSGRLTALCVDIGETVRWGRPKDERQRHLWPNYSLMPFNDFKDYDLVLVDGRFRMACALNALLNAAGDFTLLVHDYTLRKQLHRFVWTGLYEKVQVVDSLGVFKPRPVTNRSRIQRALVRYQYLPDDLAGWENFRSLRVANRVRHYVTRKI